MSERGSVAGHAVIIGGGIAGLVAARVLADHVERVTVLEAAEHDFSELRRKGSPSSNHIHNWITYGARQRFEELFEGFTDAILAAGGELVTAANVEVNGTFPAPSRDPRYDDRLPTFAASHRLIEREVFERVGKIDNVAIETSAKVTGLDVRDGRLVGVRYEAAGRTRTLACDLGFDATGYAAVGTRLLTKAGLTEGLRTLRGKDLPVYTSRWYRSASDAEIRGRQLQLFEAYVPAQSGVMVSKQEAGLWVVTAFYVPDKEGGLIRQGEAFDRWVRRARSPFLQTLLERCEPEGAPATNQMVTPRYHYYVGWDQRPARFLPLGGALCFMPGPTGMGLNIATASAEVLSRLLAAGTADLDALERGYLEQLRDFLVVPWFSGTHEFPTTSLPRVKKIGAGLILGLHLLTLRNAPGRSLPLRRVVHGLGTWKSLATPAAIGRAGVDLLAGKLGRPPRDRSDG